MAREMSDVIRLLELWGTLGDVGREIAHNVLANDTQIADVYDDVTSPRHRTAYRAPKERAYLLEKITVFIAHARTLT